MRRRVVREKVVQALYAHEISGDPVEHVIEHVLEGLRENAVAHEFARRLVVETVAHAGEIDGVIRAHVANWDLKRIAVLDRLILRMSICELLYFKEIPPKVSMNEAIELAKLFSTSRSGQFVNGVLDAIFAELDGTNGVAKAGRGLYDGAPEKKGKKPPKKP